MSKIQKIEIEDIVPVATRLPVWAFNKLANSKPKDMLLSEHLRRIMLKHCKGECQGGKV